MPGELMPASFEDDLSLAVETFWLSRSQGSDNQAGSRGQVIGGTNLDGFEPLLRNLVTYCGFGQDDILFKKRTTLPGYFRPTKNWDVLIMDKGELIAVIEFKSQVGSLGNNFNNRAEEALGNAVDFQEAGRRQVFGHSDSAGSAPFLGYLMLLEDSVAASQPRGASSPHFDVLEEFRTASYAERYRIFCERLMEERLYNAAGLVLTSPPNQHRSQSAKTSAFALFARLAGHLQAYKAVEQSEAHDS